MKIKRIVSIAMCIILCVFTLYVNVSAKSNVIVEIVDFITYINIEDNNSVIVKLNNKSTIDETISLDLCVATTSGDTYTQKSAEVLVYKNGVVHYPFSLDIEDKGEYNITLSAKENGSVIATYTKYIYADFKTEQNQDIGVCTHFDRALTYEADDMTAIRNSGFSMIRDECRWDDVELKKGEYNIPSHITDYIEKAEEEGIEVLMMLSFNNTLYSAEGGIPVTEDNINAFGEYVRFVVKSLKGKVKYFEVWNEPNHEAFNPNNATPAQYTVLLKKAYEIITYENPEAYVISGGVAGVSGAKDYIKGMVEAGALNYMHAFGIHPYCCWQGGVVDERYGLGYAEDIDILIEECGINKDIWITEVGYLTAYPGDGKEDYYTEEEKGVYNVRTILEFKADKRVEKLLLYQFKYSTDDESFQLINSDNTATDGYKVVRTMNYLLASADFVKKWSEYYFSVFQFKDRETQEDIFIVWSKKGKTLKLNVSDAATDANAEYQQGFLSNSVVKLDVGARNSDCTLYKYDAYGNKSELGSDESIDFKPLYIVCDKPKPEVFCDIAYKNGKIEVHGTAAEGCEYITVRATAKSSGKEIYVNQIKTQGGDFDFSFSAQGNDVYEIYVYNDKINYQKYNIGSIDARMTITADNKNIEEINELDGTINRRAAIEIDNQTGSNKELLFIAAVYTGDDKLKFAEIKEIPSDMTVESFIELPQDDVSEWDKIKLFLWEAETKRSVTQKKEIR